MNLKTKVAILAAAAASTALAVSTDNTLCRIALDGNASATNTILALPLHDVGGVGGQILVTNLVLTTGLIEDDQLMYWNKDKGGTGGWDCWEVNADGNWEAVESTEAQTAAPENAELSCGLAVWLRRANITQPIYLYGQCHGDGTNVTTTVKGSASTLVGPAITQALKVNVLINKKTSGEFAAGDKIQLVDRTKRLKFDEYTYKLDGTTENFQKISGYNTSNKTMTYSVPGDDVVIQPGQGFWYVRKGDGDLTFTW